MNVPASEFQHYYPHLDNNSLEGEGVAFSAGATFVFPIGESCRVMYAPVHLPDGAIIKKMTANFMDRDETNDMHIELCKCNMLNGNYLRIFSVSTYGAQNSIQSLSL